MALEKFVITKYSSNFLFLKESASILEQANRSYCGLKLDVFATKSEALFVQF